LEPDVFWRLTPVELMTTAGLNGDGKRAMTRAGLDALLEAYPDLPKGQTDAAG